MRYPLTSNSAIGPEAIEAGVAVLRSGRLTMGAQVEAFESEFAAWVGAKHAVMVNSGSSANLLAVEALLWSGRWTRGQEIPVPALAWSTTVFPLAQLGLVPTFLDVDADTLALRHEVDGATIHVLGRAAHPATIEDCCEAFGAHYLNGAHVGTKGVLGTFSHFYSHQLTCIEGGTVITNDDAIADDLRSMRAHGWTRNRKDAPGEAKDFRFVTTGYNVRPMEVQAAIAREQLKAADRHLRERDQAAATIIEAVSHLPWLEVVGASALASHLATRRERQHSWMNVPIRLRENAPISCADVRASLHADGIETRPILAGNLLKHPVMQRVPHIAVGPYPVADRIMRDGFMIGCHHDGLEQAVHAFHRVMRATKRMKKSA